MSLKFFDSRTCQISSWNGLSVIDFRKSPYSGKNLPRLYIVSPISSLFISYHSWAGSPM